MLRLENGKIIDLRCKDDKLFADELSVCYTLLSDDITKGQKPASTPYIDRCDPLVNIEGEFVGKESHSCLKISEWEDGLIFDLHSANERLSEFGINLPFNFMGRKNGGGWKRQLLFNSPYKSAYNDIIYTYLTKPDGNNLVVAILTPADGWKMDYSPYSFGHYFVNLKLLSSYDKAYKTTPRKKHLRFAILPAYDFDSCLEKLSGLYGKPFLSYDMSGGKIGTEITLKGYFEPDSMIELYEGEQKFLPFTGKYTVKREGEVSLIPCKNGALGAEVTVYGYKSLTELYKRSMDTVDLDIIKKHTDGNLCEHQCWASATLRFLLNYGYMLTPSERGVYESRVLSLLDVITEENEDKAVPRQTILKKAHLDFLPYNVYKSKRVQELFFGITILLDAYKYFKEERYLEYLFGATDTLLDYYQGEDGRIEIDWGNGKGDYTTVCSPMIPLVDVALFIKDKDKGRYNRYISASEKMAEYLYKRGMSFPTEGAESQNAEAEMEDGSISCTALSLLYFCKNVKHCDEYLKKAKEILDIHECWIIKTPICQMHSSTLRWWETQWEGDGDGPAICAGHSWTIWRAEADYLYYELTNDPSYLTKARNGFLTNLSKIDKNGVSYSIYNPDEINGGGLYTRSEEVCFKVASRYASVPDCGISRYVWIRINETGLE